MAADRRRGPAPAGSELVQGEDYYLDASGRTVFTEHYNRRRGFCCFLGCRHCPWGQAGRGPEAAQAALHQRLSALQRRVSRARPPVRVKGYSNGVLFVSLANIGSIGDRSHAEPQVRAQAKPLLTVRAIEWV